jgi:hypothetical protein
MAEAGFWIAWGLPTQGRERQALDLLNESRGYFDRLAQDRQIERFDIAVLKPQTTELQLVADPAGIVDAWVEASPRRPTSTSKRRPY